MALTLIPYRLVNSLNPHGAPLALLEVRDTASTSCTDPGEGDRNGRMCLCHWAPWFDGHGRPDDGPDPDYAPALGDPLADLPAAELWRPRIRQGAGRAC